MDNPHYLVLLICLAGLSVCAVAMLIEYIFNVIETRRSNKWRKY
jgi:hypothetical protein